MEFSNPKWLIGLYFVPIVVVLLMWGVRQRRRELTAFAGIHLLEALSPGASWRKVLLKNTLAVTGLICLVLALAGPQFGSRLVKIEREGIDLVIALDTSLSMLAEDMKPNRLERAKQEITDLIAGLKGDRVGLVAFAGDAFVLCPLTVDYNAATMFAQSADQNSVSKPGSALDQAIKTSVTLFPEEAKSDQVIILVTDGETHAGDPLAAAREAAGRGIRIYTIGIGNPAGELIPLRGTGGSVEGYKKDSSGETVLTRLDEVTLEKIARVTGGQFLPATREGLELKVLYREISGLEKQTIEGEFMERKIDRFGVFLALSFAFLLLEAVLSRRGSMRRLNKRRFLHSGVTGAFVAALLTCPHAVYAKGVDGGRVKSGNAYYDAQEYEKALHLYVQAYGDSTEVPDHVEGLLYNHANALHMMKRYEEALSQYHRAFSADDSLHAGRLLYNRGNTLLAMEKPDTAIESYLQALRYLPDDEEIRHNLEMALRKFRQQQQQQQQNKDGEPQDHESQENQEQQQPQDSDQNRHEDEEGEKTPRPDSTQTNPPQEPDSTQIQQPDSLRTAQLTVEDALRLLRLLEEKEKQLQKDKRKAAFKQNLRGGKDW